jgi:hypothetical protein
MPITGQIRGAKQNKNDTSERLLGGVSFDLITLKGIFLLYDEAKKNFCTTLRFCRSFIVLKGYVPDMGRFLFS